MAAEFATDARDLTVAQLNAALAELSPGTSIERFEVVEVHEWGGGKASTAGRLVIEPAYAPGAPGNPPRRLVIKIAKPDPVRMHTTGNLYRNEVNVYAGLRPWTFLEAPKVLGAVFEPATATFLLLMEDLRDRGATFGAVTTPVSVEAVRSLLDQLAILHARYWGSAELEASLGWMERHTKGAIHDVFNAPQGMCRHIANEIATVPFKREMVERLGVDADWLFAGFQKVQQHQARLPQTVCHGDTHVGNTYFLPGDQGGLLDWQLSSQGYGLHDVSYLIATALPVAQRRAHERELLAHYRERLIANGVAEPPSADDLRTEYRRGMLWGVYVGWLTTPVFNYGWEISVMSHLRVMTAFEDLETKTLVNATG